MRVDIDPEFSLLRLTLLAAGFALFAWGLAARRRGADPRRLRLALLGLVAASAFGSYFYFYRYSRLHVEDTFHYYLGSKYFPELGYYGLYDCSLQALGEAGRATPRETPRVRNLRTMRMESSYRAFARGARCKEAFSAARWNAFAADARWFRSRLPEKSWAHVIEDHGYHPSPVWTLFGRPLASLLPASAAGTRVLARVDHALVLGALLFVGFTVGWETACLAAILWGTGFLWRHAWIGDAFLRHLWLACSLAGLSLLWRRRHAGAAILLTTAALLRVFPALFLFGWALHALRELWRERALSPATRRFAVASALGAAVLLAASVPVSGRGLAVYPEFVHKISRFAERPAANKMGLGTVTRALEGALVEPAREGARVAAPAPALHAAIVTLRLLLAALGLLAFWRAVGNAEDWEAAALGATLIPLVTDPTNYYYSFVLAALFLALRRPRIGVVLFLACMAWSTNGLVFYRQDVEFVGASLIALALSFAILSQMASPPSYDRGGAGTQKSCAPPLARRRPSRLHTRAVVPMSPPSATCDS